MTELVGVFFRPSDTVYEPVDSQVGDLYVLYGAGIYGPPPFGMHEGWQFTTPALYPDDLSEYSVVIAWKQVDSDSEPVDFSMSGLDADAAMFLAVFRFDFPVTSDAIDPTKLNDNGPHVFISDIPGFINNDTGLAHTDVSYLTTNTTPQVVLAINCGALADASDVDLIDFAPTDSGYDEIIGKSTATPSPHVAVASYMSDTPGLTTTWQASSIVNGIQLSSLMVWVNPAAVVSPPGRLSWDELDKRYFETGLDRGVLYTRARPEYPLFNIRAVPAKAVPWNGLIGVDESGADSVATYYMDGRPYLVVPQPKEFSATIKAYTYPDEFSAVMGLVEATDGMYVDSQMGDLFDLSYRTKIGNAIDGVDHGYKIHLIYNAAVAPQDISYSSLDSNVSPNEFSWKIDTVPVPLAGFRSTAHIEIDTRHMEPDLLADLESILYGSETTAPYMPTPQEVFDMLSFGDTIIITDNHDGTWKARGSRNNVFLLTDGVFEIDNVNATDNGDGTFTFSTGGNTIVE